ncbi:MAG: DUF1987 domain-containing protein [Bacteroidales bacterium]|jgi:hypothetical protein|nr:DUF1987 domain-containing protein [Bacteroidales bacterium]
MEHIEIYGTSRIPTIQCNAQSGTITIKGRSIQEDASNFYQPIIEWLTEYSRNPQQKTVLNMELEYFNTSSSKSFLSMFKLLEQAATHGSEVSVNWYYEAEDYDMLESGENYQSIVKLPFQMIERPM